jgi:hypothetical protein
MLSAWFGAGYGDDVKGRSSRGGSAWSSLVMVNSGYGRSLLFSKVSDSKKISLEVRLFVFLYAWPKIFWICVYLKAQSSWVFFITFHCIAV